MSARARVSRGRISILIRVSVHKRWRDADQQFAPELVAEFENEDDAYRLEAELIFKYGRSDQGTGTLLNWLMADG
jgi:hypothetical protein